MQRTLGAASRAFCGAYRSAGCPRLDRDAKITDPKAITTKTFYDDLSRRTATVKNYKAGSDYWTVEPLQPKARAMGRGRFPMPRLRSGSLSGSVVTWW